MATSDIIAAMAAGTTATATKRVGKGKAAVEVTITRTAPEVVVVDETVKEEPVSYSNKLPVDEGKVRTDILPGLALIRYSRGYAVLEQKGKTYSGAKTKLRRVLYREDLIALANSLLAEAEGALSYDEAHGNAEVVPF
jgi:hypothetical protein